MREHAAGGFWRLGRAGAAVGAQRALPARITRARCHRPALFKRRCAGAHALVRYRPQPRASALRPAAAAGGLCQRAARGSSAARGPLTPLNTLHDACAWGGVRPGTQGMSETRVTAAGMHAGCGGASACRWWDAAASGARVEACRLRAAHAESCLGFNSLQQLAAGKGSAWGAHRWCRSCRRTCARPPSPPVAAILGWRAHISSRATAPCSGRPTAAGGSARGSAEHAWGWRTHAPACCARCASPWSPRPPKYAVYDAISAVQHSAARVFKAAAQSVPHSMRAAARALGGARAGRAQRR